MCGIAGIFTTRSIEERDERALDKMLDTIVHRGPDSRNKVIESKHGLAMGHTRLIINDHVTGEQPLQSQDGRYLLTVNGEFYDFKRYRAQAMSEGHRYETKSDSEIALSLFSKYGLDFVHHLRGEFAFTLYDKKKRELILVRDRFGVRPLFYYCDGKSLIYGSEAKAVLAHPDTPSRLRPEAIIHQMMQTMAPGMSAFEGIYPLEPGRILRVREKKGKLETEEITYWDFEFPRMADRPAMTEEEAISGVRDRLIESIILRLEADVPVGCYLSGGIDSCCILGLATGAMQSPVKAYTISFDHDSYDESKIALEMAESMHADHEMIHLKADDLYGQNYVDTVIHSERSFYNTLGVAKNLMSKRVWESGYRTVITGEGSDELFGGYPAFKRDMFLYGLEHLPGSERRKMERQLQESNKLFKGAILSDSVVEHPAFNTLCGFTPSWIQPWISTLLVARPLLSPDLKAELIDYDPIEAITSKIDRSKLDGRHPLDKAQYTWSKTQLEGQILNWGGDRVDMANSMESRPAFLDHHLAEFATLIPPEYRIKNGVEKWVLREAVKGVLPEVLYKREKFPFMAPPAHTDEDKQSKLAELLDEYASPQKIKKAGIFDSKIVSDFLNKYRADTDPVSLTRKDTVVNHLLCIQILEQELVA
jgi:asparagine synthase (glutamine-hydrolysing)